MADHALFLDRWVCERTGIKFSDPDSLEKYQVEGVKRTLAIAREKSRFYSKYLSGTDIDGFKTLADLEKLPFTTPKDIAGQTPQFACVSQSEVDRIFTLKTSGTTGVSKRICFTREELLMTRDYFGAILSSIITPGSGCLIFFPGNAPLSAGDLIRGAVADAGATAVVHGFVSDFQGASAAVRQSAPEVIIGLPVQMQALGEFMAQSKQGVPRVPYFILTGDHVAPVTAKRIETMFNSRVLSQYGLTETGFGAAVQCTKGRDLHVRSPHLVVEIVDIKTGKVLPEGVFGEVVVTTLERRAMPLIRYRTGDLSRRLDSPCPCGSPFPRLDRVKSRFGQGIRLETGRILSMADLDDVLFDLPGVVDFSAAGKGDTQQTLDIRVAGLDKNLSRQAVKAAVKQIDGVKDAVDSGRMRLGKIEVRVLDNYGLSPAKRIIMTKDKEAGCL